MADQQQHIPSTDTDHNMTPTTSMSSSIGYQHGANDLPTPAMSRSGHSSTGSDTDFRVTPPTLAFMHHLMESNEANAKRVERLLEQQERHVKDMNAKEMTILKLKSALEHEKDLRARLEEQLKQRHDLSADARVEAESTAVKEVMDCDSLFVQEVEKYDYSIPLDTTSPTNYSAIDSPQCTVPKKRKIESDTPELYELSTMIANHFPSYIFRPYISVLDDQSDRYGRVEDLAPAVLQSLLNSLDTFHTRLQRPLYASHGRTPLSSPLGCGHLWMTGCTSSRAWTVDSPGKYTCKTCFNARRACFVRSHGEWIVLPLPPEVRDGRATYRDAEYYIFSGQRGVGAKTFPGVWEEGLKEAKARARRLAGAAGSGSGESETPDWTVY